jgi:hypothetical protein
LALRGRPAEAEAAARRALEILDEARRAAPEEPSVMREQATAQARLGRLLAARPAGAEQGTRLMGAALSTLEALDHGGMTVPEVGRALRRLRREMAVPAVSPAGAFRRDTP